MIEITFKGQPVHVNGPLPEIGSKAPDFQLIKQDLSTIDLKSLGNKKKILNVFVSLDTPVCAKSIHTFHAQEKSASNLVIVNISMDLPFAASRFCKEGKLANTITGSAFRSRFPKDYGIQIMDGPLQGLCARAVFVLSEDNKILYRELVPEITHEPNYSKALV